MDVSVTDIEWFCDDAVIGACGVGGGTGEQDEQCALAGIAKL